MDYREVYDIRPLASYLNKPNNQFNRADILKYCIDHEIRMINFRYPGIDGKLKLLKIPINNRKYLDAVLAQGERADGSSLYRGVISPGKSDLYIVPVYKYAYLNPFEPDELDIVCRFFGPDGQPANMTFDNILINCHQQLQKSTGYELHALGELEFYTILDPQDVRFTGRTQRNYHQADPYMRSLDAARDMMQFLSEATGAVKYCHSEVGYLEHIESADPELKGKRVEQFEIEFLPCPVEDMATYLTVAKWIIRNVAYRHNMSVSFTPKLDEQLAGSGLHFHMALMKNGKSVMRNKKGELSDPALQLIGGLLSQARPLSAFGNSVASAFLRLVPNHEAPTRVCYSEMNRSALVRVPLGWNNTEKMEITANPQEINPLTSPPERSTVELRSPDASAFVYLLLAAMCLCGKAGLEDAKSKLFAIERHVEGDIFKQTELLKKLEALPENCWQAAQALKEGRKFFEGDDKIPGQTIDFVIKKLEDEQDKNMQKDLAKLSDEKRLIEFRRIMHKDLHKH